MEETETYEPPYKIEARKAKAELSALAAEIATHLNALDTEGPEMLRTWELNASVGNYDRLVEIRHGDSDERLWVSFSYRETEKIHIEGRFPTFRDGNKPYAAEKPYNVAAPWMSIGASKSKGAKKIAGDIVRRLLPDYRAQLAKVQEVIRDTHAAWDKRNEKVQAICRLLGKEQDRRGDESKVTPSVILFSTDHSQRIEVAFEYDGDIQITLRTNHFPTASMIASAMKGLIDRINASETV